MTKRRVDVDMGPMHLTVGEDTAPVGERAGSPVADALSVERFRQAMGEAPDVAHQDDEEVPSPFELFGRLETQETIDAESIGAAVERLCVERMWAGVDNVREVRMKLSASLLPGTSVRIHEVEARLQVELLVSVDDSLRRIESALPSLARDIGTRLHRSVRLMVIAARGGGGPPSCCEWSPQDDESSLPADPDR